MPSRLVYGLDAAGSASVASSFVMMAPVSGSKSSDVCLCEYITVPDGPETRNVPPRWSHPPAELLLKPSFLLLLNHPPTEEQQMQRPQHWEHPGFSNSSALYAALVS